MSATQIASRMLCSVAKVDMGKANKGQLEPSEWQRVHAARNRLAKTQVYIDDNAQTTPVEILSKCRRLKREKGLDLVMVDYLQLMTSGKKIESRQQEVSEISRNMKIAAKELNVPILLLSQMSRDIEKRQDKKPQMSDLRESGAIEQDADIIIFLHRDKDPNDMSATEDERTKCDLIVAKHRNGSTGTVTVRWHGEYTTFEDLNAPQTHTESALRETSFKTSFTMSDDNIPYSSDDIPPLPDAPQEAKETDDGFYDPFNETVTVMPKRDKLTDDDDGDLL
jgi:replicative DNA helicase